jgi:hypothetical protein
LRYQLGSDVSANTAKQVRNAVLSSGHPEGKDLTGGEAGRGESGIVGQPFAAIIQSSGLGGMEAGLGVKIARASLKGGALGRGLRVEEVEKIAQASLDVRISACIYSVSHYRST